MDYPPLLLADATIESLRAAAATDPFRRRMVELQIQVARADREAHAARTRGDAEAGAAADLKRAGLVDDLDRHLDQRADAWLAGLSLALDRRPAEVADLLTAAVRLMSEGGNEG